MAYQALYRRWRPRTFDEVVGQDALVGTLQNQIAAGRIGHAYLFTGTRGTGKTTAAKIMAKAVNCPSAASLGGNPCNACPMCLSIDEGAAMNVLEIDAASNNGVDNIRAIREEVEYPPVTGRYKVYIIDEIHMLSAGAFNALLKTLEEPPEYVIFILATTDPDKLPATIVSRCQRFDLRRIGRKKIEERLGLICEKEGIKASEDALRYIAEAADGSMRDGISLLDRCSAYRTDTLSLEDVLRIVGAGDVGEYRALYERIVAGDPEGALMKLAELYDAGADILRITSDMIMYLRNVLLAGSLSSDAGEILDISGERLSEMKKDAGLTDRATLIHLIREFAALPGELRYASAKRVLAEMLIIRLCTEREDPRAETAPRVGYGDAGGAARRDTVTKDQAPAAGIAAAGARRAGTARKIRAEEPGSAPVSGKVPAAGDIRSDLEVLSDARATLVEKLHPTNRSLFADAVLKEENGSIVIIFKNKMNFRLASENQAENGVLKLRALAGELLGHDIRLLARPAKPGELGAHVDRVSDEELKRINFPVETED